MNTKTDSDRQQQEPAAGDPRGRLVTSVENASAASAEIESIVAGEDVFQRLDVRWIGLSRSVNAITFLVIGAVVTVSGIGLLTVLPGAWKLLVPLVWALIGGACALSVYWWPRWEYDRWSYHLGSKVLELRSGVIWRSSVAIPLSRLQHVDLHRGPLERKWRLASLQIHTAGTRHATHTVPGLDVETASTLRDQLIDAANRGSDGQHRD